MNWQLGSNDYGSSHIRDFDDASSDSTIRLEVSDSSTERVRSAWTELRVDTAAWERSGRTSHLSQRHLDGELRQPPLSLLGAVPRRTSDDPIPRTEHVALSKTVAADGRRMMDIDDGRSSSVSLRHRPSSASSSASSAGLFISLLFSELRSSSVRLSVVCNIRAPYSAG